MMEPASRWRLLSAFAAVYLIWGSTYLAIRFAIETLPPFLMASVRFLVAGTLLYVVLRVIGTPRPARTHWRSAAIIGGLLLLGGNGGVVWAEQKVPSGVTALMVATIPLWMAFLPLLRSGATRPSSGSVLGILLGFAGVALLIGPSSLLGSEPIDPWGALALLAAALFWSIGSLLAKRLPLPSSSLQATAMEMLAGGALLLLPALITGEPTRVDVESVSSKSILSLAYLIFLGAIVGYSAYVYLLKHATPSQVSTYAYVNPVIAVVLGWWLADEPLGPRVLLAAGVILLGVLLIVARPSLRWARPAPTSHPAPADPIE